MSFQGDISSIALSDVLQNLAANQKTGTLTIEGRQGVRRIQFRDGKIISYADDQGFSIADWLRDKEIVSAEKMEEALRRYKKTKRKSLGEILADMGVLSLEDYRSYLVDLVKETLYEVLSFREGTFSFEEGVLDEDKGDRETRSLGFEMPPQSVMMEAARRMDDWQKIRLHIPAENEIYHAPLSERQRLLEKAEDDITREALDLMDGSRTLRQVIGKLPYPRFDACRCLAALIAEKKVKPLDGTSLVQFAKGDSNPKQVVTCLKTILEREPNNREILKKLADLQETQGQRDESAMYNKLLAISHLDVGDLGSAEDHLRRSVALSPKDLTTWQKLWDVVKRSSDQRKMMELTAELTAHFRTLGLMEVVRDHLLEVARLFPDQLRVKLDLCDAQYALGEHKVAVQGLFEIGRVLLRKRRFDEAEKLFARILKYDRDNSKAREVYEKLRSGKLVKRQAFRQKLFQGAALFLFIALSTVYLIYDIQGRGKLFEATRGVFADSLLENRRYDEAIHRIREIEESHPFSLTASYEVPRLLETLLRKQKEAAGRSGRTAQPPAQGPKDPQSR